jgi:hypothetical protein
MSKKIVLLLDNRIRDRRQPVARAKQQRDQAIFDIPAAGGTFGLEGSGPGGVGSGFISDGSGEGFWGASGQPICYPVSQEQTELVLSGNDKYNDAYINPAEGTITEVFFDYLLAEPSQYTLSGSVVTPFRSLETGTIVTARVRPI